MRLLRALTHLGVVNPVIGERKGAPGDERAPSSALSSLAIGKAETVRGALVLGQKRKRIGTWCRRVGVVAVRHAWPNGNIHALLRSNAALSKPAIGIHAKKRDCCVLLFDCVLSSFCLGGRGHFVARADGPRAVPWVSRLCGARKARNIAKGGRGGGVFHTVPSLCRSRGA